MNDAAGRSGREGARGSEVSKNRRTRTEPEEELETGEPIDDEVSAPKKKPIRVTVRIESGEARFEVRDEGPGITAEDRKRLFGKFQRLSARTTGGESSSGLGLSIARQLVELQGGRIWAESEEGKGSLFTIAMPVASGDSDQT